MTGESDQGDGVAANTKDADREHLSTLIAFVGISLLVMGVAIWTMLPETSLLGHRSFDAFTFGSLVLAFCLAEVFVAGVAARTGSHTFSPSDLVLMIAMLVAPPKLVPIACVVGLTGALVFRLKGAPLRLFFNVAQTVLSSAFGVYVATLLAGDMTAPSSRVWIAALSGVAAAAVVGSLAVDIAVTFNDGRAHFAEFGRSLLFATATALGLGSLGVLVVWASRVDHTVLVLVVPPMGITFFALRASLQQRQQREDLEFLYEALRAVANERDTARGLLTVAVSLKNALRAREAILHLHSNGGWHVLEEDLARLVPVKEEPPIPDQALHCESNRDSGVLLRRIDGPDGCLAIIELRHKTIGRSGFSREDQRRVDQLADQLGVHLENSGLSQSLEQLEQAEQLLRTQVETDHLTGLANRAWLHGQTTAPSAVILLDLDGFKSVNDTLGHDAGDRVLSSVGARLTSLIPAGWTAVRLGGDEFAVVRYSEVKPERREVEDLVALIEERCVDRGIVPADLRLGASAGAALRSRTSDDLDELLRRADSAMYAAKRARKNRIADAPVDLPVKPPRPLLLSGGGAS